MIRIERGEGPPSPCVKTPGIFRITMSSEIQAAMEEFRRIKNAELLRRDETRALMESPPNP